MNDASSTPLKPRTRGITTRPHRPLSAREREVARLVLAGRTTREIADELGIGMGTTEQHCTHIYWKLGIGGRNELAAALRGATP